MPPPLSTTRCTAHRQGAGVGHAAARLALKLAAVIVPVAVKVPPVISSVPPSLSVPLSLTVPPPPT